MELNIIIENEHKINQKYNYCVYKRKNLKILIIDDDESISSILQDYLELRGHKVETVNEGTRGISKNNIKNYDIIFIDLKMPRLNGIEAVKEIQSKNLKRNSFFVALTATVTEDTIKECFKVGMDAFISKPIQINDLSNVIEIIMKKKICDI